MSLSEELRADSLILVADDDSTDRQILGKYIKSFNYRVAFATSGREAMEVLRSEPNVALLITDIAMPDLDGIHLLKHVTYSHPRLPVMVVTGTMPDEALQKFLDDHKLEPPLSKPFDKDAIQTNIQRLLENHFYDEKLSKFTRKAIVDSIQSQQQPLKVNADEEAFLRFGPELLGELSIIIKMYGPNFDATLIIGGPLFWWSRLATSYLGNHARSTQTLYDFAGEFTNEMATRIREHYMSRGLDSRQTPQFVMRGRHVELLSQSKQPSIVFPFSAQELHGQLFVEILIERKGEESEQEVQLQDKGDLQFF